jgi:hypothetical protein
VNKLQGSRGVLGGTFVKIVLMMFAKNIVGTNTISATNEKKIGHHILIK